MYPKAAVDVSMLVPSISHAQIPNPVKCKIPSQSPGFSSFQPKNYPLDSTKTLLFQGYETNGHWLGTAYVFKRGCPPIPYHVEGSLQSNYYGGRYVRLRGPAPFEYIGCNPFSYSWDANSDLVFDYLEPRDAE
jgi:hypothetical protein